ncbi:MAG: DUF1569 domain-containing protein [Crocinitomicaceae bacterium]|nr:DUF1569 domain-containing protein [Crocinitomicaceae bacterium]
MKSLYNQETREEVIARIQALTIESTPLWGKMNVTQMLKHCEISDQLYQGQHNLPRIFMGKLFGRIALNKILKAGKLKKNLPTDESFKFEPDGDIEELKQEWINRIREYERIRPDFVIVHPYFGKLSRDESGQMAFIHGNHHLTQFKV